MCVCSAGCVCVYCVDQQRFSINTHTAEVNVERCESHLSVNTTWQWPFTNKTQHPPAHTLPIHDTCTHADTQLYLLCVDVSQHRRWPWFISDPRGLWVTVTHCTETCLFVLWHHPWTTLHNLSLHDTHARTHAQTQSPVIKLHRRQNKNIFVFFNPRSQQWPNNLKNLHETV